MLEVPAHRLRLADSCSVTLKPSIGVGVESKRWMLTGRVMHEFVGQIGVAEDCGPTYAGNQPMSRIWPFVMSIVLLRSALIAGSISAFFVSETSQCDTDEPPANVVGAYILMRPTLSEPDLSTASRPIVTLTPAPRLALIVLPSACEMPTQGMVIAGLDPPIPGNPVAALLTMITPAAPAACAAAHLTTKVQVPRSISAMLPASAAALVMASQPSAVGATASMTCTTLPVNPGVVSAAPNVASCAM